MKTFLSSLRCSALITMLVAGAAFAAAAETPSDRAEEALARNGVVSVKSAGPYVEIGTPEIQVRVKLGQPAARLADGSWVYRGFVVKDSEATGSLVVRFEGNRVSALTLVSRESATALLMPRKINQSVAAADVKR